MGLCRTGAVLSTRGGETMEDSSPERFSDYLPISTEDSEETDEDVSGLTDPANQRQLVLFSFLAGTEQFPIIFV
jgi:hypothetical protein